MVDEYSDKDANDALHVEAERDTVLGHSATRIRFENSERMYNSRQSGNNDHRKVELVIFRDIFATEAVEICHVELVGPLICSLVDFKVANTHVTPKKLTNTTAKSAYIKS